jgi:hypothetical protein
MRFGPQTTHFLIDNLAQIQAARRSAANSTERRLSSPGLSRRTTVLSNAGAFQRVGD